MVGDSEESGQHGNHPGTVRRSPRYERGRDLSRRLIPDGTWRDMAVKYAPPQQTPVATRPATQRCIYRPMTVGDEVSFAWALAGAVGSVFSVQERAWMCVTLGAGDFTRVVIERLLAAIATHGIELSDDLVDSAFDWLIGFTGTEDEPRLKALVQSVCPGSLR